MDTYTASYY